MSALALDEPMILCSVADDEAMHFLPQQVFAKLLELAWPQVKHYRTDFYHDAIALKEIGFPIHKVTGFHYNVRDTGTAIILPRTWTEEIGKSLGGNWYYIEVGKNLSQQSSPRYTWEMIIKRWDPIQQEVIK